MLASRAGSLYRSAWGNDQKCPIVVATCRFNSYGVDGPSRARSPMTRYEVGVNSIDIIHNIPYDKDGFTGMIAKSAVWSATPQEDLT